MPGDAQSISLWQRRWRARPDAPPPALTASGFGEVIVDEDGVHVDFNLYPDGFGGIGCCDVCLVPIGVFLLYDSVQGREGLIRPMLQIRERYAINLDGRNSRRNSSGRDSPKHGMVHAFALSNEEDRFYDEKLAFPGDQTLGEHCHSCINERLNGEELAPGWRTALDPASGIPYYYHESTSITTWTKPTRRSQVGWVP